MLYLDYYVICFFPAKRDQEWEIQGAVPGRERQLLHQYYKDWSGSYQQLDSVLQ
jgi:hypothetical protein